MYLKGEPVEGELTVITTSQVREADYNLSPNRWVGQYGDTEHRSVERLVDELKKLSSTIHESDKTLFALLEKLQ